MFPDPDDPPPCGTKSLRRILVSSLVRLDLLAPEGCVGLGPRSMPWAAMPEAAIDEDCQSVFGEYDVHGSRRSRQQPPVTTVVISAPAQQGT